MSLALMIAQRTRYRDIPQIVWNIKPYVGYQKAIQYGWDVIKIKLYYG
jgi:hypothetical protein